MPQKNLEKTTTVKKQQHSFLFDLDISPALSKNIGSGGISNIEFDRSSKETLEALQKIYQDKDDINLLSICDNHEQVDIAKQVSNKIQNKYKKLIIFGMGGSSFGGQALCGTKFYQYLNKNLTTQIIFIDNIHYHNFSIFLEELSYQDTAFLTISKSGSTLETLSQILVTKSFFEKEIQKFGAKNFFFITENTDNPLSQVAASMDCNIIPHHLKIGGRYSCFTSVAMIPAHIVNINLSEYVLGGKNIIEDFLNNGEQSIVFKGATLLNAIIKKGYSNHVFIPYLQRLYQMIYWYAQLFAESLGKNGKGMTPVKAIGSVDQHSQLQLFLEGPKNKFFTFITQSTQNLGNKIIIPQNVSNIDYLNNNTLGNVINANQEATIKSLINKGCPVRRIHFHQFNDKALGEIMMFFMLETILLGYTTKIDPFDQPAVEIGKKIASTNLSNSK